MATTLRATFDGQVLRPEHATNLEPNTTYIVTIERTDASDQDALDDLPHPLTVMAELTTDLGVTDFAERHDWYARVRQLDDPDAD